jgi:leader peptidase (prepilin peptidase) / N-methyltransferase
VLAVAYAGLTAACAGLTAACAGLTVAGAGLTAACAGLGALVGALVPPLAYRLSVPYGAPARTGCDRCGTPLRWRSRCPGCHARPGPAAAGWIGTGALVLGGLSWALGPVPALVAALAVAVAGLPLAAVDLSCLRLPDPLVGAALAGAAGVLAITSIVDGQVGRLARAGAAAVVCAGGYAVLRLVPRAGLGLGDVKLAGVLGLLLGWLGWPTVLLGMLLPYLLNGPVALVLLATGRIRRDTALPLGPALLAGGWLAILLGG